AADTVDDDPRARRHGADMASKQDLIARAEALAPGIAARAAETDANRAIADETVRDFIDAGVFATLAPKVYGGLELGFDTFAEVVRRISAASPSVGWVASFLMGSAWRALTFPRAAQEEMYGGRNHVLIAGAAAPIREVRRAEGGYVISGRTAWNSASSHADWFTLNGLLVEDGAAPQLLIFALPRADVTILDTW